MIQLIYILYSDLSKCFSGGLLGCERAVTDFRCIQSAKSFYNGEAFDSATKTLITHWYLFISIAFIWWWNQ
jgi:hypothetical protein